MYRSTYHNICIAYHVSHITVSHIMYCISCLAHPVSHHLYARPWEATRYRRPREATASHGRPRSAPHRPPPKILYLLKWAGRGRQKGRLRRKPATGGNGGQRGATARQKKSPATPTAPFNILEDPYKLRLFGEYSFSMFFEAPCGGVCGAFCVERVAFCKKGTKSGYTVFRPPPCGGVCGRVYIYIYS